MAYQIPDQFFFRLHFERSRFSSKLEDVLLILASKIISIGMMEKDQFNDILDEIISDINENKLENKTIRNHRTEMIRLFGLVKYVDELAIPGNRLSLLSQTQDTPRFFKSFCSRFQFPGGFLKPYKISEMVLAGIKFKPAQFLLRFFKIANSKYGRFAINAAEVTHFILYDLRVTAQGESPDKTLDRLIEARSKNQDLDKTSDLIRYARDFLNYMVEANLLIELEGMYALNEGEKNAIHAIIADKSFFDDYSSVIRHDGTWDADELKKIDTQWMEWFADGVEDERLETPVSALVRDENYYPEQWKKIKAILERKDPSLRGAALKAIGDEGEQIVYEYEKETIKEIRPDLVQLVRIVSSTGALGYDIISIFPELGRMKKYIEVKTTKKNHNSDFLVPFTMSINEWTVANQLGADYFIYRVVITKESVSIFSIQNPAKLVTLGKLAIEPIGFKVLYSTKSGNYLRIS